ncbi:hypothetical protein ACFQL1_20500 [Halomicroarcula sp. GCM10025709]|uniref:hypothetical protein n=1 Tax=Halomicroarcula sp. GCM10025709 TaxID=3252669 RepID=UPI00360F440E
MTDKDETSSGRFQGILTESDREFLLNKKENPGDSLDRDARYRIRKRLSQSLEDFILISGRFSNRDIQTVFQNIDGDPEQVVGAVIRVLYQMTSDGNKDEISSLEEIISRGIETEEFSNGNLPDVDTDIMIETEDVEVDKLIDSGFESYITRKELSYIRWQGQYKNLLQKVVEKESSVEIDQESGENYEISPLFAKRVLSEHFNVDIEDSDEQSSV